jgi:YesN/AraC family two-component response regulator
MVEALQKKQIPFEDEKPKEGEAENVASSFIVKNAMKYIENNYKEKLTLSEVAEKTYVSQWHLSKLLNKHMEQNFSEILNSVRIREAKELLKDPARRIGDIAEEVGFIDMDHFSRVFKKLTGFSANEYRNHIAKNEIYTEH